MSLWRLIGDSEFDGVTNMAMDEALLLSVRNSLDSAKVALPVIRFYSWQKPELSLGYGQHYNKFKDLTVPIVRRLTGGKAVLHLPTDYELTYSISCPSGTLLHDIGVRESYCLISKAFISAFNLAGVKIGFSEISGSGVGQVFGSEVCFSSAQKEEISVNGLKLIGSAQRRYSWGFLQQGSVVLNKDSGLTDSIFGSGTSDTFTSVNEFSNISVEEIKKNFLESLAALLDCSFEISTYSEEELLVVDSLVEEKYSNFNWTENKKYNRNSLIRL